MSSGPKYDELEGVRISHLVHMDRSPLHYQYELQNDTDTDAKMFGRYFHAGVFEGKAAISRDFVVYDPDKRPSPEQTFGAKVNAQWLREIIETAEKEGKQVLKQSDRDLANAMAKALFDEPDFAEYRAEPGQAERVKQWKDKDTGILCKGRVDDWKSGRKVILELKTTLDASPQAFTREAYRLNYHTKAAWYFDGFGASRFLFVTVEKNPPHAVCIMPASADFLAAGRTRYKACLKALKICREKYGPEIGGKRWPGYYFNENQWPEINLPGYAKT